MKSSCSSRAEDVVRTLNPPRPAVAALTLLGASALALVAARRWLRVVVVEGSSMAPTYHDGDTLLALYGWPRLRRGEVVVVRAPTPNWTPEHPVDAAHETLVKRLSALAGDRRPDGKGDVPFGAVYVEGDAGGYDSRAFGPLPQSEVLGRVLARLGQRSGRA